MSNENQNPPIYQIGGIELFKKQNIDTEEIETIDLDEYLNSLNRNFGFTIANGTNMPLNRHAAHSNDPDKGGANGDSEKFNF